MTSIVLELQQDALNKNVPLADLLRKALVVARKLKVTEFETWLDSELNGYQDTQKMPAYRQIKGSVKIINPFMGIQPLFFADATVADQLSSRPTGMTVAALEALIGRNESGGMLSMQFPSALETALMKEIDCDLQPIWVLDYSQIVSVLDTIRNIVLKWALQLEEEGILGEGLSFATKEKEAATSPSVTHINNYFQNVSNSQIQQDTANSSQDMTIQGLNTGQINSFINAVCEILPQLSLTNTSQEELKAEVNTIKAQVGSPKPKDGIIKQSLSSIKSILEKASGTAVAQLLIELGKILI